MGSVVVVEVQEGVDAFGDFVDVERQVGAGVELVSPDAVAALDGAVELWRSGREDVKRDFGVGAGLFEFGHELASAVDLDGPDGIGHLGAHALKELGSVLGGGARIGLGDGPFIN